MLTWPSSLSVKMADQQRENELFLELDQHITGRDLDRIRDFVIDDPIPPADLEGCSRFSDICRQLTRKGIITHKNHKYLIRMLSKIGREDLRQMVANFDGKQNKTTESCHPLTCLYNHDVSLPVKERLTEFLQVLEKFLGEGPDAIPQQVFYINAAAGIAWPKKGVTIRMRNELSMTIQKGSVTKEKIIYCHFVEGLDEHCLQQQRLHDIVYYSIPVLLGPPGEEFKRQVFLKMTHNAVLTEESEERPIKFFVRQSDDGDSEWREGGEHFCEIEPGNPKATILLDHFTEIVIGVDPRTTTSLPPLRARLMTCVTSISEKERCIVFCLLFDSPYMIQKAEQLLRKKEGKSTMLGVATSQEIILEPRVSCKIKIEGRRWISKDQVEDVTKNELDMLVFNPISRKITMVLEETDLNDTKMCNIVVIQNTQTQEFTVSNETFELSKPAEDEASTLAYNEAGPEYIERDKGSAATPTIVNSFLSELDRQRAKFMECIDKIQEQQKEQTMSVFDVMHENFQHLTIAHQKQSDTLQENKQQQAENYQSQIDMLKTDLQQMRTDNRKQNDTFLEILQLQKTEQQKQMEVSLQHLQQQRADHFENLQQQKIEYQKYIDVLQESLKQQNEDHQTQINAIKDASKQKPADFKKKFETISKFYEEHVYKIPIIIEEILERRWQEKEAVISALQAALIKRGQLSFDDGDVMPCEWRT